MKFVAAKASVFNRGSAPDSFLVDLIAWGKLATDDIFASNNVPVDLYTIIKSSLGTRANGGYVWDDIKHRRAAMLEAMRVHAGMETSWSWKEGVDKTNKSSMKNRSREETGIFQVSFDSLDLGHGAMKPFAIEHGIETVEKFIPEMKQNHTLALEYYARLVRVSIAWAGPLLRHGRDSIYPWLSRDSMREIQAALG